MLTTHVFLAPGLRLLLSCTPSGRGQDEFTRLQKHTVRNNTFLINSIDRVPLKKLIALQLIKKFPTYYRTRKLISLFTAALYRSLS